MWVERLLEQVVCQGRLILVAASGKAREFGDGSGPPVTIRLRDPGLDRRLALSPDLAFGEAYMDGSLTVEAGSTLYDALFLLVDNVMRFRPAVLRPHWADPLLRRVRQFNPTSRARRNVAHHYDLSGAFYELFLDRDRQYSCAYFDAPADDLDQAQLNKKRHIASKLLLEPGMRVLDIGSGWGGLALYLAAESGVNVTGITLSVEQHKFATARAAAMGLAGRVRFELCDYRAVGGRFDRIVSVGMFEHVGIAHYATFFHRIRDLLTPDGVALLHAIGRGRGPGTTNPWLRKYIFPGGYCPALSEVLPHIERTPLWVTDLEILRLHYAHTLRGWREWFMRRRDQAAALYDERFCRMWEFYLTSSELGFRLMGMMVFQIQLARRMEAVPITRDYMAEWEEAAREPASPLGRQLDVQAI